MMIPNQIWEIGLTGSEIAVFLRIFFRAGFKSDCFESRSAMAEACCLSEKTVSNCFAELERLKLVRITRRKTENKPNLITINRPAQWISKRNIFPENDEAQVNSTQGLRENLPKAQVKITHVTIFPEQDSNEQDSILNTIAPAPAVAVLGPTNETITLRPKPKAENKPSDGSLIFEAYSEAYQQRYKLEPLRNAKVNSICAQIAKQVPLDEAKAIMHFYLRQNVSWYVQKGHAIEYAQKDLQALRTNMMKNQTMSTHAANNADKIAAQKQALENFNERQNHKIDESIIFGGDLRESDDFRKPLGLLRSKT